MTTNLNSYANVFSPTITSTTTNHEWFAKLKTNEYKTTIDALRALKPILVQIGNPFIKKNYDDLKKTLPVITWNATFSTGREDKHFLAGTGLLNIDIDSLDFNNNILDHDKIYASYKSVGGLGYCILVRVETFFGWFNSRNKLFNLLKSSLVA